MEMMKNAYRIVIRKLEEKKVHWGPGGDGREDCAKLIRKK
jgi:hypothetical protein